MEHRWGGRSLRCTPGGYNRALSLPVLLCFLVTIGQAAFLCYACLPWCYVCPPFPFSASPSLLVFLSDLASSSSSAEDKLMGSSGHMSANQPLPSCLYLGILSQQQGWTTQCVKSLNLCPEVGVHYDGKSLYQMTWVMSHLLQRSPLTYLSSILFSPSPSLLVFLWDFADSRSSAEGKQYYNKPRSETLVSCSGIVQVYLDSKGRKRQEQIDKGI